VLLFRILAIHTDRDQGGNSLILGAALEPLATLRPHVLAPGCGCPRLNKAFRILSMACFSGCLASISRATESWRGRERQAWSPYGQISQRCGAPTTRSTRYEKIEATLLLVLAISLLLGTELPVELSPIPSICVELMRSSVLDNFDQTWGIHLHLAIIN